MSGWGERGVVLEKGLVGVEMMFFRCGVVFHIEPRKFNLIDFDAVVNETTGYTIIRIGIKMSRG